MSWFLFMVWDILNICLRVNVSRVRVFGSSCRSCRFRFGDTPKFFHFEPGFIALVACRLKDLPCFIQLAFDVGGRI